MRLPRLTGALLAAGALAVHPLAAQVPDACRPVMDPARRPVKGTTLTMDTATFTVGAATYTANVYNRQFVAPTLTMEPGEPFQLSVVNNMHGTPVQPDSMVRTTNFHTHGLVVTPNPDGGDNVTNVAIPSGGGRRAYDFPVPAYHTTGMFWYHPHPHMLTSSQVGGGLSGALLVGSILRYFPQYRGVRERTLLIRDMSFSFASPLLFNVNGSTCATFPMASGEEQLWHIGNFGANHFVNLKLRDAATGARVSWTLLALDGNPLAEATTVDSLYIPPGSRAEVIVTGPAAGRAVELYTDSVFPKTQPRVTLGYLVADGARRAPRLRRPAPAGRDASVVDTLEVLRTATDMQRDTFTYEFIGEGAGVNGRIYEPGDAPVMIPWGKVHEWTIVNGTTDLHTFHIHQTDFLVMSVNGRPADEGLLRDNIPIGVHRVSGDTLAGDTVVIRFLFQPIAEGPFVFHCHVLQHEDEGMMMNVCVYDPANPDEGKRRCAAYFSGAAHAGH